MKKTVCCFLLATMIAMVQYPALAASRQWTDNGRVINDTMGAIERTPPISCVMTDTNGIRYTINAFADARNAADTYKNIYLQKTDQSDGSADWGNDINGDGINDGINISTGYVYSTGQYDMIADGSNVIVAWTDARDGNHNVYVQKIDEDGNSVWASGGVPACTESNIQDNPKCNFVVSG